LKLAKRSIYFIFFLLVLLFFLFFPIVFINETENNIKIYSSGPVNINFFAEENDSFYRKTVFFYTEIPFKELSVLNVQNYILLFQNGKNQIQKQTKDSTGIAFYKNSKELNLYNNVFYNELFLEKWIDKSITFLNNISEIQEEIYILYLNSDRSFQILPNVYIINSEKDLVHELSHYFFGYKINTSNIDTWHEILAEVNSMLYLREFLYEEYLKEIELKKSGFYAKHYGEDVLKFLDFFNYDSEKIFDFQKYLLKHYTHLNNDEFKELLEKYILRSQHISKKEENIL
jgi:hypothetical protein